MKQDVGFSIILFILLEIKALDMRVHWGGWGEKKSLQYLEDYHTVYTDIYFAKRIYDIYVQYIMYIEKENLFSLLEYYIKGNEDSLYCKNVVYYTKT